MPMAALYCDERALATGRAKSEVLASLADAMGQAQGGMEVLLGGPWEPSLLSLSWEDLVVARASSATYHPSSPPSTSAPPTLPAPAKAHQKKRSAPDAPALGQAARGGRRRDTRPSSKYR